MKDDIVIDLIKPMIQKCESEGKDYIVEGFPRTVQQVVFLQKLGIAPDYIFSLETKDSLIANKIKNNLINNNTTLYGPELDWTANNAV